MKVVSAKISDHLIIVLVCEKRALGKLGWDFGELRIYCKFINFGGCRAKIFISLCCAMIHTAP